MNHRRGRQSGQRRPHTPPARAVGGYPTPPQSPPPEPNPRHDVQLRPWPERVDPAQSSEPPHRVSEQFHAELPGPAAAARPRGEYMRSRYRASLRQAGEAKTRPVREGTLEPSPRGQAAKLTSAGRPCAHRPTDYRPRKPLGCGVPQPPQVSGREVFDPRRKLLARSSQPAG